MEEKKENKIRSPIVTLVGHVDHGKTTLLDAVRKTNVVQKEHGGITQHIGAYQIIFQGKPITFIDTPGHAAFEKMRSRGTQIADIIILVVAANEGVKPQTKEAIGHIKVENKPIIVAITKTDLEGASVDKVKKQLQAENVTVESYGGQVPVVEVVAPQGKGLDELLEVIQLVWQISPQPYLPKDPLEAVVVESYIDKNRGHVATVIVKKGKLVTGHKIVVDSETVTVKSLIDDRGQNIKEAVPGTPVEVLGFKKGLEVGSIVGDLTVSKMPSSQTPATLEEIIARSEEARDKFKLIIKADVTGSLEAICVNLPGKVLVLTSSVGEVTSADISFAKVAHAPILAFNVKVARPVKLQAQREGVLIKNYNVIYDLFSEIEEVVSGFEQAKHELKITGRAKIIATFNVDGQKIAGAQVVQGKLKVGDRINLKSTEIQKGEAEIASIKRFKKDLEMVSQGQECGIRLQPNLDFDVGDIIESLGSREQGQIAQ